MVLMNEVVISPTRFIINNFCWYQWLPISLHFYRYTDSWCVYWKVYILSIPSTYMCILYAEINLSTLFFNFTDVEGSNRGLFFTSVWHIKHRSQSRVSMMSDRVLLNLLFIFLSCHIWKHQNSVNHTFRIAHIISTHCT